MILKEFWLDYKDMSGSDYTIVNCWILEYMIEGYLTDMGVSPNNCCIDKYLTDIGDGLTNCWIDGDKIIRRIKFEFLDYKQSFWEVP